MPTILPLHPTPTRNQSHAPTLAHLCPLSSGRSATFFYRTVRALLPSAATVAHLHPPTCARATLQHRTFLFPPMQLCPRLGVPLWLVIRACVTLST